MNDAGKELSDHPGRVAAFLDFLGAPPDDPRRGGGTLYSAHDFGEAPKKVSSEADCLAFTAKFERYCSRLALTLVVDWRYSLTYTRVRFGFMSFFFLNFRWFTGVFVADA